MLENPVPLSLSLSERGRQGSKLKEEKKAVHKLWLLLQVLLLELQGMGEEGERDVGDDEEKANIRKGEVAAGSWGRWMKWS